MSIVYIMKRFLLLLLLISFSVFPSFSSIASIASVVHIHPAQEVVYITKTGTKYHKGSCHYLKKSKIKSTKSEAKSAGYSACSVCKP